MKEYANLINAIIDAINRNKVGDCHQELTALVEVAFSAVKFDLFTTLGVEKASNYFSDMNDYLRNFSDKIIGVTALMHQLYNYFKNVCSLENISDDRFVTIMNYIKMMTDIDW